MKHPEFHRLPAPLEPAVQTLKLAARTAVERTIESLGLAALAAGNAFQRDGLLAAQFELNRKSAVFVLSFNDALDDRVLRELGAATPPTARPGVPGGSGNTSHWDALSLVADHEVEQQISADRFGLEVAHACEWELREFDAYVAAVLHSSQQPLPGREQNPLRPQVVGHAMVRAIESVSERPEVRKQLSSEISRSLAALLRPAYADIVGDLRRAGVQPRGLSLQSRPAPRTEHGFEHSSRAQSLDAARSGYSRSGVTGHSGYHSAYQSAHASHWEHDPITGVRRAASGPRNSHYGPASGPGRPSLGAVDPALMNLIRRLSRGGAVGLGGGLQGPETTAPAPSWAQGGHGAGRGFDAAGAVAAFGPGPADEGSDDAGGIPNLILTHREALRQASRGSLDHMVIDVIAGLFDQILSDPKVPPQMARLIARLQLPVLRAALGDTSFFSSRRHPVRRFINRIASLGAAFDDYSAPAAQRFLHKVRALVQEVVEGEFDQIETYESKLQALEAFMAAATLPAAAEPGAGEPADAAAQAAELLAQKEDEIRLRQLYAQRLEGELRGLAGPTFVHDFITRVWSQVVVRAAARDGADSPLALRLRQAGRELFMSVQPKATPAARKAFLAGLPRLMQELTEGMNLIGWPEEQRHAFFGQLMPAHAEALKNSSVSVLDTNLLARQVEAALAQPLPSEAELRAATASLPVPPEEVQAAPWTPEEAQRLGLLQEAAVDWTAAPAAAPADVDIDLTPPAATAAAPEPLLPGSPLPAQPDGAPEPTEGRALADHVQVGFAYHMQLEGQWQKVRLAHVNAARSFFIFSHGQERAQQTLSLTRRMLEKLCAAGRLRAYEQAYLVERATERARRQLARLAAQGA